MENSSDLTMLDTVAYPGGQDLSSPKGPFQCVYPSSSDSSPGFSVEDQGKSQLAETEVHHHRTCSASFLIEQPSWLEELLDEPEVVPLRRTHRRSSSDSAAYLEAVSHAFQTDDRKLKSICEAGSSWELHHHIWQTNFYTELKHFDKQKNGQRVVKKASGSSGIPQESVNFPPKTNTQGSSSKNDNSSSNNSASKADSKRAKQQYAQRSRLRKLQYIADLERHVHALQAEGFEVSSALKYFDQQILVLVMENQALRQRLESLSQEQILKYLEKEMLERELARLQYLYQQQQKQQQQKQQQQQHKHTHNRSKAREVQFQMTNLTM